MTSKERAVIKALADTLEALYTLEVLGFRLRYEQNKLQQMLDLYVAETPDLSAALDYAKAKAPHFIPRVAEQRIFA